ncbi:unnamed protein product [Lactuca saligna]|uniref:Uncharacterized protein n=1 Tax=Lactuca saligna TaxID=75948 RepID=A0AA35YBR6_LACSI|nr:unnamed protein product [Lactuca saligna]
MKKPNHISSPSPKNKIPESKFVVAKENSKRDKDKTPISVDCLQGKSEEDDVFEMSGNKGERRDCWIKQERQFLNLYMEEFCIWSRPSRIFSHYHIQLRMNSKIRQTKILKDDSLLLHSTHLISYLLQKI